MVSGTSDEVFVGRGTELARIGEVIQKVQHGQPWLVSIEGESGIGKTALATRAVAPLAPATDMRARGDPGESDLPYGVVQQLFRAVDRKVLARHQLLVGDMSASSPFAVGAELLGLIGEQQEKGPVAIIVDDVQWADVRSVEALSFTFRRLSVDPVAVIVVVRGDREHLDDTTRRLLLSVPQRLHLRLPGLSPADLASLAVAVGAAPLDDSSARRLFDRTGGHTLYVRTVLGDPEALTRLGSEQTVPLSLAAAIGDQLAVLPAETQALLEMLAVANTRLPLALLGNGAGIPSPSKAIEPAVRAGLVEWWPYEPTCPVVLHHALQRDAIYARLSPARRRELHAQTVALVAEGEAWRHRVASLDGPDEGLAGQLEGLADKEAVAGQLALAATHLRWASDISPGRENRERRLLTAALHLTPVDETGGLELRTAVEAAPASPLRSCVLGTMALWSGQINEARPLFEDALAQARLEPAIRPLAASIATRLAGTYILTGEGDRVRSLARWALDTGCLSPSGASRARTMVAVGASQTDGVEEALADLVHLDIDPARVDPMHVDGLAFRGVFYLVGGDLSRAAADLTASLNMVRKGATLILGLRAYSYLALAQYFSGAWDDALLTAEQGLSASTVHPRDFELPLMLVGATCVPAGRGAVGDAERHAHRAEQAADGLDYGHEQLYAGMARAMVCQATGDYAGMARALGRWMDRDLDGRSRLYEVIWLPLLIEGQIGSGRHEEARLMLHRLASRAGSVGYLQSGMAWLEGWLAEEQGDPQAARQIYEAGENAASAPSPVYRARLLLAHGRLLRRTGQRRPAIERLRQADALSRGFGAEPLIAQAEDELAACGLHRASARRRSSLELTTRESEVAHLIDRGMTNAEIASELFITPKAVEYHLGNIYAKFGVKGRQQLRRFLTEARRPSLV